MIETWQQNLPHGITLSCRACGQPDRPVLLFLHGFPEAAFVWDDLMAHFLHPDHGAYRCIAPNLRGYERSSAPDDVKAYRAKHLVQDIEALICTVCPSGTPLAGLVAHDWGGAVAWNLANQHPELMEKLVIINSPHPGPLLKALQSDPAQQAASAYMNFLVQPQAAAELSADDFAGLFGFLSGGPSHTATWLTPEVKAQYREVWQHGIQGGLNYYRASPLRPATASDPGVSAVQIAPEFLRIDVPTLVLWAQDDVALLPCLTDGLDAHIPDLKLQPIDGATHWVVHEQPERVKSAMADFLQMAG
jgi:pimeloyl-ACP methyl ester carboxylesterase